MKYEVVLHENALQDLDEIWDYIAKHDAPDKAEHVISEIVKATKGLSRLPGRGNVPPELRAYHMLEYREIFFKPYRIFYWIGEASVNVFLIADGRRDIAALLLKRLYGK